MLGAVLSMAAGSMAGRVSLPASVDVSASGSLAAAAFAVANSGLWSTTASPAGTGAASGTWLNVGAASAYEGRMVTSSGALTGGIADTWQSLGTTRTYTVAIATGSAGFTGTYQIRYAASGVVLTSCPVSLGASE